MPCLQSYLFNAYVNSSVGSLLKNNLNPVEEAKYLSVDNYPYFLLHC